MELKDRLEITIQDVKEVLSHAETNKAIKEDQHKLNELKTLLEWFKSEY